MPYIDLNYYTNVYRGGEITFDEFEKLLPKASDVLDNITNDFYQFNNLEEDIVWRSDKFKKAVACQIEYFHDIGASSSHQLNNPLTVNMGRTQVMTGVENQKKVNKLVAPDVYMHLERTGLLYRGVGVM